MAETKKYIKLWANFKQKWQQILDELWLLGGISHNNHVRIFHDGDEAFKAIHEAIIRAEKYILIETYILASDNLGLWLREALIAASKNRVKVNILYDHIGSVGLSHSFLEPMLKANIEIKAFNPIWPWRRHGPLLLRNHRKIIVIDDKIAFCGGMNISEDYASFPLGNSRFRDSMVEIKGPGVLDLKELAIDSRKTALFRKIDQEDIKKPKILVKDFLKKLLSELLSGNKLIVKFSKKPKVLIQVLGSNKRRNLINIQKSMEICLKSAVNYCYFTSPYFLPYEKLLKAMIKASARGVDLKILTAGISDVPLMHYASHHVYKNLLLNGIRIYEMDSPILHAKIATIDNVYASIGSYNLDHWSARRNLEVNVSFLDQEIAGSLKNQFEKDLKNAHEINIEAFLSRSLFNKILCFFAYQIMRL